MGSGYVKENTNAGTLNKIHFKNNFEDRLQDHDFGYGLSLY